MIPLLFIFVIILQMSSPLTLRYTRQEMSTIVSFDCRTATEAEKTEKNGTNTVSALFHLLVPLMKCESADMRDTIVNGLGYTNPAVFK